MGKKFGWSVAGVLLLSGMAMGQGTAPPSAPRVQPGAGNNQVRPGQPQAGQTQPAQVVPGQGGGQRQQNQLNADQEVAALIAACNRNEVAISKFAIDRLKSDEAKEVATMLIKEHTAGAEKFQKLAGDQAVNQRDTRRGEGAREEGREERREDRRENRDGDRSEAGRDEGRDSAQANPATAPNNPNTRVAVQGNAVQPNAVPGNTVQPRITLKPAMAGHLDWSVIHQQIADEGLASCKEELSRYEGNDFDKAFLGHQLGAHMKTATELKVLRRHVSAELATEIDSAHETVEKHIKHLRKVMDDKKDEK